MLSSPPTTASSSNPPTPHTVTSDPRHVGMETYWREVHSIEEEKEGEEEEDDDEEKKSIDGELESSDWDIVFLWGSTYLCLPTEVEMEEAWLMEAGLSSLVTGSSEEQQEPLAAEAVLSTLTRQQSATVKRRLDNYNETLRKRNRQPVRDVRDIFTQVGHT